MKYVKQIGIILGVTLAGEALSHFLPFPVPAGVYGLFLMLTALMSGIVKLESVEGTGNFLMDTMSMMFIPATVGIIESADQLRGGAPAVSAYYCHVNGDRHGSYGNSGPENGGERK